MGDTGIELKKGDNREKFKLRVSLNTSFLLLKKRFIYLFEKERVGGKGRRR